MRVSWIPAMGAIVFSMASTAPDANAQKRVALVIGNSVYQHAGELQNPRNDAADIASSLKKLGFLVVDGFDPNKAGFDRKIRDFATALQGAEAGLFFFAGHGLQVAGHNYLVPVDAELKTASAIDFEMVRLDVVQRVMEHETSTNILFLDACRDNPLARNLARALGTRSAEIGHGFAPAASGVGTLISFSTQPGNVALDGMGRNSPFADALVKSLAAPKDDLSAILIEVRNDVMRVTQNKQVPWEHSALRGRFYFRAPDIHFHSPAKVTSFDGSWLLTFIGGPGCEIKSSSSSIVVRNSIVVHNSAQPSQAAHRGQEAQVEANGQFKLTYPNSRFPGQTVTVLGTLKDRSGSGSYFVGPRTNCSGMLEINRSNS